MGRRGLSPWYAALALLGAVMLTALLYSLNEENLLPLLPSGRLWSKPQTQGWCIYLTEREDGSPGLSYQDPWGRQWMKATWETSAWGSDPVRHTTEYRSAGAVQRQQPGVAFSETRNEAGDPERLTVVQVGKTGFTLRYEYRNGYLWMVNGEGRLS